MSQLIRSKDQRVCGEAQRFGQHHLELKPDIGGQEMRGDALNNLLTAWMTAMRIDNCLCTPTRGVRRVCQSCQLRSMKGPLPFRNPVSLRAILVLMAATLLVSCVRPRSTYGPTGGPLS